MRLRRGNSEDALEVVAFGVRLAGDVLGGVAAKAFGGMCAWIVIGHPYPHLPAANLTTEEAFNTEAQRNEGTKENILCAFVCLCLCVKNS
jgi:hypothetical protein